MELSKISNAWDFIRNLGEDIHNKFHERFGELLSTKEPTPFVTEEMSRYIVNRLSENKWDTHGFSLSNKIEKSLNDKLRRFQKINIHSQNIERSEMFLNGRKKLVLVFFAYRQRLNPNKLYNKSTLNCVLKLYLF